MFKCNTCGDDLLICPHTHQLHQCPVCKLYTLASLDPENSDYVESGVVVCSWECYVERIRFRRAARSFVQHFDFSRPYIHASDP